ncbi:MAG: tryptophan-rich sensory protein [Chloroflexota bacterium]|nr:tryptophan-rich sensory protein [Chloroflexota bacterium]
MSDAALSNPRTLREYRSLLASIAVCQAAGGVGVVFTSESVRTWYPTLRKPSFNPPSWVFGPVWTILYLLMGISLFLTRRARQEGRQPATAVPVFAVQLVLNSLWSFLFFRLRSPGAALVEIVILWAAIALTVRATYKLSKVAALLLLPYLLWTSFAAALNFSIWRLNRTS